MSEIDKPIAIISLCTMNDRKFIELS